MRLRAGLPVLWRGPTAVQVGTDPRWAVVLTELSPSAARALTAVPGGTDERGLRSAMAAEDVPADESAAVLDHLRAARLLISEPRAGVRTTMTAPDLHAAGLLDPDGDPSGTAARRTRARVRVEGLGRLGTALAAILAGAGIGVVEPADPAVVTAPEVGIAGLTPADVGSVRSHAVAGALRQAHPRVHTEVPARAGADLVVLVERGAADPVRYRRLVTAGAPHLSVVLAEASVAVGPLVLPGRTACLGCLDLHRTDRDDAWPRMAAQLVADRTLRAGTEETTLAAVGAALAAVQVLAHVDGRPSAVQDATLQVALPGALPVRTTWAPHRECRCGAQVGT